MILVFAGAGASKAVSPREYPTTIEFFEQLPDNVRDNAAFVMVCEHLTAALSQSVIDIEQVLWALGDLDEFNARSLDTSTFPGWLIEESRINRLIPPSYNHDFKPALRALSNASSAGRTLVSQINQLVYQYYRRPPTTSELNATWAPFISNLKKYNRVEFVTTNYDLILEHALDDSALSVRTGRATRVTTQLQTSLWDPAATPLDNRDFGLLTKLHGSVDWIRGDEAEIFYGVPRFTGRHQQHAIIYPGFKGRATEAPFSYFHEYFRFVVQHATAAVFVGFAFRDEYINEILRERLSDQAPVAVIGWGPEPPNIPFASDRYQYFGEGFSRETGLRAVECINVQLRSMGE